MGPLLSLFGGDNVVLSVIVALAAVVVLIILGVWALKLVFNATGRASRGRAKRLGVVDISPVDQKRHLVLIRRDNVEHLLLVGGPQDVVVETGISTEPVSARMARSAQPQAQPSAQQQPAAPAPTVAQAPSFARQRARGSNLPPDLPAVRPGSTARNSLRHTALVRPSERLEPDFIPTPAQAPSEPAPDSDKQPDTEPVPTDAGAGSAEPDYRGEPNLEQDGDQTRPDESNREN